MGVMFMADRRIRSFEGRRGTQMAGAHMLRGTKGRTHAALVSSSGTGEIHVVMPDENEGQRPLRRRREKRVC
ncbi:hypothetical protein Cflav_PD2259 [Pedosphaera parvula Ellin514]|uniref:Uncharacterized protein n=1 Tax=Pedosphaera parvula (strain Ellin514) TaxID=320771 RepID=B9XL64_PEDPL|nr:hypothetical protein Cflav_PD2259 [Pedosphaera parvula Ellin514]